MLKKVRLAVLISIVLFLVCVNLMKYYEDQRYAARMTDQLTALHLAMALGGYYEAKGAVPSNLRMLVPEYFEPHRSTKVTQDRVERPGGHPILYIYIDQRRAVVVVNEVYWVVGERFRLR